MFHEKLIAAMLPIIVCGCAGVPAQGPSNFERGLTNLRKGRLEAAYRFLEDPPPNRKTEVIQIFRDRPDVIAAGAATFTPDALKQSVQTYGRQESFKIERKRMEMLREYAGPTHLEPAELSFTNEFGAELAEFYKDQAERTRVSNLPQAEQNQYWADRYRKWQESVTTYGRVMSAQLINESQHGTNAGAQLGALTSQAAYIDSRNIYNYSAMGQLQAGLIGGMLGGMLDRRPLAAFRKVYFLKSGEETKRIDLVDGSQVLFPIGACIAFREPFMMELAAESNCLSVR